jgi:3-hydroxyacyl-[acyl-carrier-protein] dehydratase
MTPSGRFSVRPDHPALPGHFPGRPIVPGVVLLDRVVELIAAGKRPVGLPAVKFMQPVLPGDEVEVRSSTEGRRISFSCAVGGVEVARGTVLVEAAG